MKTSISVTITFRADSNEHGQHSFRNLLYSALIENDKLFSIYGTPSIGTMSESELTEEESSDVRNGAISSSIILDAKSLASAWYFDRKLRRLNDGTMLPLISTKKVSEMLECNKWDIYNAATKIMMDKILEFANGEVEDGITESMAKPQDFDPWAQ